MFSAEGITIKDKVDFNKDLDGYIHKRRKGGPTKLFGGFSISRKSESRSESRPVKEQKSEPIKEVRGVKKMDDDYQELDDVEMDEEETKKPEKKGGFKGFFKKFKSDKPKIEEIDDDEPVHAGDNLPDDVKEVLKISLKWIQELAPARLKDFKNSPDFEKFKEVLVKYKVAKPTEKK
jgi:hypothetical protein